MTIVADSWIPWFALCVIAIVFLALDELRGRVLNRRSKLLDEISDALDERSEALDARSDALDKQSAAIPWDGVGPERRCLLRELWPGGTYGWSEYEWQDFDGDDAEDGDGHEKRYLQEFSFSNVTWNPLTERYETDSSAIITHWAEVPEVEP